MRSAIASLAFAVTAALAPTRASANWMGLADGDYAVTLHCTFSSVVDCSLPVNGTIAVSGSGLSAMDFDINGETFVGDPTDAVVDGNLVDTESSTLANSPFSFLSLRLITDGSIGTFVTGDRWWVYCNNSDATHCSPNTTGLWSATPLGTVGEPPALAALALTLAGLVSVRRRRAAG